MEIYPAKYTDNKGEFETTIRNDWKTLRMNLRGVEFSGSSFDYFRPDENELEENLRTFSLDKYKQLSNFKLECEIPVKMLENNKDSEAVLRIYFEHKILEISTGFYDYELKLILNFQGQEFCSTVYGDFEDCFGEIRSQLRKAQNNIALKCCFGCKLSDYSVYGHDVFGSLICFKDFKERFLNMKTQYDYCDLLEEKNLEYVQEVYLCPEFQPRYSQAKNLNHYVD